MTLAATCLAVWQSACASNPTRKTALPAPVVISPDVIDARLAEADALAARGCYLCLRQAAGLYYNLLQFTDSQTALEHTLQNDLMMAIREREFRMPDSGAEARARAMTARLTASDYAPYFSVLDIMGPPLTMAGLTMAEYRALDTNRKNLADTLEKTWRSSPMAAHFYIAAAVNSASVAALTPQVTAILQAYPDNLAVRYRFAAFAPTNATTDVPAMLAAEPRFAELHFLRGQRAVFGGNLVTGHSELSTAYKSLPDSLTIAIMLGNVELAFGRYTQALELFDAVLRREPDHDAQLGRAISLSSLKRHREAIADLDEMLTDPSWRPGDKYYWRAWNYLQLAQSQPAYDDANAALKSMANSNVYQLAGIASYNLTHVAEARTDFEASLQMNASNCDSIRYLGILDAAERHWPSAETRFTSAAACYRVAIENLEADLAKKRADTSGLYEGQVAVILADIAEAKALVATSEHNAEVARVNAK